MTYLHREVRFFMLMWCHISACRLIPQERLMYNSIDSSRSGLPGTLHGARLLLSLEYLQEQKRILNFWKVCCGINQKPQRSFWWPLVSVRLIYWHFPKADNHGPLKQKLHSVSRFFESVNFFFLSLVSKVTSLLGMSQGIRDWSHTLYCFVCNYGTSL